eukprot:CAMPEP_0113568138 /NCGR_PEP_ID=MMETSP0015_2-20120614/23677_1 /TAXON_ID=2838 /ORGANISM="Odontella" /LENGTH=367 /DNA_ID=CAMNT_0000470635 /DNA_START=749 /DNA_END=1852 /DNA_ORIENTATION=+ /assembly_acc=CAM_ASM_000160
MDIADQVRESVRAYTGALSDARYTPPHQRKIRLVGITTSDENKGRFDPHAEKYSEQIALTCTEDGISYELWRVPEDPHEIESAISRASTTEGVHGVLVLYPIFQRKELLQLDSSAQFGFRRKQNNTIGAEKCQDRGPYKNRLTGVYYKTYDDYFRDIIPPTVDVEGLCQNYNARWMFRKAKWYVDSGRDCNSNENEAVIFPCTALAVARVIESCHWLYNQDAPIGRRLEGSVVTIINRSEILGRPLAAMLANDGATVYSIDIDSVLLFRAGGKMRRCNKLEMTIEKCVRESSVVVTGVPSNMFKLPVEWIQNGSTVINVASELNVDEEALRQVPGIFFVPHVGKVTVALLEHNLVSLHRRYHAISQV